jgi:hypothetical protein
MRSGREEKDTYLCKGQRKEDDLKANGNFSELLHRTISQKMQPRNDRSREAREQGKRQSEPAWGLATLAASEGGQPGLLQVGLVGFFLGLFLFLRVGGLGYRWFSVNEGTQLINKLETSPTEVQNNANNVVLGGSQI